MVKPPSPNTKFGKRIKGLVPDKSFPYYQYYLRGEKHFACDITFTSSKDIHRWVRPHYENVMHIQEQFSALFLSQSNKIKGFAILSVGGINSTVVDPLVVMKYAIDLLSPRLVLVHNHPSGNLNPSEADRQLTNRIKQGCELFGIQLLDHLILTDSGYFSFADEGWV